MLRRVHLLALWGALLGALAGVALAAPVFPVKPAADKRYLVDQNGVPFPILGRTAWFITSLSVTDYRTFIDDTAARGYTAIEFHVVNHDPRGNNPPFNGNGVLPFLKRLDGASWTGALTYGTITNEAPNFTTPNETYWTHVDGIVAYAESKGLLVFLFPGYVGFAGGEQGWMQELVANGPTRMQSYGAWIATRYKNQKNLVWMMGGDMGTAPHAFNTAQTGVENALLNGLKSVAGQQSTQFSAEWDSQSIATDQTSFGSAMTLNGVYSWTGDVNTHGRRAYARSPVLPAFLLEEPYDEEGADGNGVNPNATQPVRRFQWWGWLSTIGGYVAGNGYVWPFRSDNSTVNWRNHLDTSGTRDLTRLNTFIGSIPWTKLVPSGLGGMRTLVTAGGSTASAADYVAAAAAADGTLLVAYVPPAHSGSITVDMAAMSGLVRARWFDPTSGNYSDIAAGLTNSGARVFTPPGNNSAGATDWVLLLDRGPDATAPAIKITSPTSAAAFTNTTGKVNLSGTASDNVAVKLVIWSNDRGGGGTATGTNSWSVSGVSLAPGNNLLTVAASDVAGNTGQATLAVLYRVPPFFLQQPAAQFATANDTVSFISDAGGDAPLRFQWRKNGINIAGATNRVLTLANVTGASGGSFSVVVANLAGSVTSSNASLKVFTPPTFTSQPVNRTVTAGGSASFSCAASGTAPLSYQWRLDGVPVPGATNASYSQSNLQTNRAGLYSVVVSNFAGVRASSNATLRVNVPPKLLTQPAAQRVLAGPTNLVLQVQASGTAPLRYQWRRNGTSLAGATNASFVVTNVTATANYSVTVANPAGSVTSSNAALTMFTPPTFTSQPVNRSVKVGGSASFSCTAGGTAPLFYQWRHDGEPVPWATNASYSLANIQSNRAGLYSVMVSNFAGVRVSSNATLTVNVPPGLTAQPVSQVVPVGSPATFTAAASGTAPLRFQWRKNGLNLVGATNATYVIAAVTNSSAGNFSVVVANVAGSVTSSNAVLSVTSATTARLVAPATAPELSFTLAGDVLILSWPAADGFKLESTTDMVNWTALPPPALANDRCVSTNSVNDSGRFFRLTK